jgi:hypothetical protein
LTRTPALKAKVAGIVWLLCAVLAFVACSGDAGSEQDLAAQLERLPMPGGVVQVGESYEECPSDVGEARAVCPTLHRWYAIEGEPGRVREALEALTEEGFEIDVDADTTMITDGDHFFFVSFGEDARNDGEAPEETDLEVEVAPVPDF